MRVTPLDIPEVLLVEPKVFRDARGSFMELFASERYATAGIAGPFVQDNLSVSERGVLRGLHFQHPRGQAKLVTVLAGEAFDVAVDVRVGSPTFAQWVGVHLSGANGRQVFVPEGFAHGFVALSDRVLFAYKCTDYYVPGAEWCIRWDDPTIGVRWPIDAPRLSDRDAGGHLLADIPAAELPPHTRALTR